MTWHPIQKKITVTFFTVLLSLKLWHAGLFMKTYPLAAISKKIYRIVHISVRQMKTAATSWQAVNAALTLANLSASVKKDTMGKDYNMNAQLVHQEHTSLKVHQVESALVTHVLMRIILLHQEVPPLKIVHARRDIVLWDKPVKLFTALN